MPSHKSGINSKVHATHMTSVPIFIVMIATPLPPAASISSIFFISPQTSSPAAHTINIYWDNTKSLVGAHVQLSIQNVIAHITQQLATQQDLFTARAESVTCTTLLMLQTETEVHTHYLVLSTAKINDKTANIHNYFTNTVKKCSALLTIIYSNCTS